MQRTRFAAIINHAVWRTSMVHLGMAVAGTLLVSGCPALRGADPVTRFKCVGMVTEYDASVTTSKPNGSVTKLYGDASAKAWNPYSYESGNVVRFYTDRNYGPVSDNPMLKGAYLLQLSATDATIAAPADPADHFITLSLYGRNVDRLWIAFDTRATTVPTWLKASFKKVSPDRFIESSEVYRESGFPSALVAPNLAVRYQLWEPRTSDVTGLVGNDIYLGGTNGPGVVWRDHQVGSQYLVLARVRPSPDLSHRLRDLAEQVVEVEAASKAAISADPRLLEQGKAEAMQVWLSQPQNESYEQAYADGLVDIVVDISKCDERCELLSGAWVCKKCPQLQSGPSVINSWFTASTANIDVSRSWATVTVTGYSSQTISLAGGLDFAIERSGDAKIGGFDLFATGVTLGDGTVIDDLTIGQNATITAECADSVPPGPSRLCSTYTIPAGSSPGFQAGAAGKVDGQDVTLLLANSQPMNLDIDFASMSYSLVGGPLQGTIDAGSKQLQVSINLQIEGDFLNLAPVASVAESVLEWECKDGGRANVTLSASASFDELHPSDIVSYEWVEDAGLLTDTSLGSSQSVTTSMAFGRHDMTLFVTDSFGVSSSTRFAVDVVDSQIDSISMPSDVWVMSSGSGSTAVALGSATASDVCSSDVRIANDAPAGSSFDEGFTAVNWTFDDQHGNLKTVAQRVFVIAPQFFPPPNSETAVLHHRIADGAAQRIAHASISQGRTVFADAYLLIKGPDGSSRSVNSQGDMVPSIEALTTNAPFGGGSRTDVVFNDSFVAFAGPGNYMAEASLVQPGGDPLDSTTVLARSWAFFEVTGP